MLKLVPNAKNRIYGAELFLLQRDEDFPKAFKRKVGALYVQVPSNLGGRLRVRLGNKDADDTELEVLGPNGERARTKAKKGRTVFIDLAAGKRKDGICTINVKAPSGSFHVHAVFEEIGFARKKNGKPLIPWNFWFFPFGAEYQPNAWDGTALRPLHKYAEATGSDKALQWELIAHGGPPGTRQGWEGHCDAAAPGERPVPVPDLKGKEMVRAGVHV